MKQYLKILLVIFCPFIMDCASTKDIKEPIAITERPVVARNKPILYVIHDDDGDWEFLSSADSTMVEVFTMPLNDMFDFDKSLKTISDLPKGWKATRVDTTKAWEIINPKDIKRYRTK